MEGDRNVTPQETNRPLSGARNEPASQIDHCALCGRFEPLFWHCTSKTVIDRAQCRRTAGDGLWLCALCEEGVHRWMRQNPEVGAGQRAVDVMVQRLSDKLLGEPRKYRKTTREADHEQ